MDYFWVQGQSLPTDIFINYIGFVSGDYSDNSISQWAVAKFNVNDSNTPGESDITFETEATLVPGKERNYSLKHENAKLNIASIAPTYAIITFDANGGTVTPSSAQTKGTSRKLESLPTPTRSNYTFNGWFTDKTVGTRVGTGGGSGGGGGSSSSPATSTPKEEPKVTNPSEVKAGDILAKSENFLPITDEVKEVKDAKVSIPLKEDQKQEMDKKGLTPRLFRFDETKKLWTPVKTEYNNGIVQTINNVTGTYAVFGASEPKFSDVKDNAWFSEDLDLAKAYGLISGIINDKGEYEFQGDKTTSRAEFYTMVARLFGAKDEDGFSLYNILEGKGKGTSNWWTPYQEALEAAGFIENNGDVNAPITRLEAMELLTMLMNKADKSVMKQPLIVEKCLNL